MPRARNAFATRKRRKKVLKKAKGYFGNKSRLFRYAKDAVDRAEAYAYVHRRKRKTEFRQLWIVRINAACRNEGMRYGEFMNGLNKAGIELNRKVLSELAIHEPDSFKELVAKAKAPARPKGPLFLGVENDLQAIVAQTETILESVSSRSDWEQAKASISGPNGALTQIAKNIGSLAKEDRPTFGQALNQAKNVSRHSSKTSLQSIEEQADLQALGEKVDPTLPPVPDSNGGTHPLTNVRRKIVSIFGKIGFTVAEATEVETEWFCFDALNTPDDHPARDAQDTLYFPEDSKWKMSPAKRRKSIFFVPTPLRYKSEL